jgi:hypothetical protein
VIIAAVFCHVRIADLVNIQDATDQHLPIQHINQAGADPGGSKRGLRHGQIFEIVIFSKLVYKDGSDRYLYV